MDMKMGKLRDTELFYSHCIITSKANSGEAPQLRLIFLFGIATLNLDIDEKGPARCFHSPVLRFWQGWLACQEALLRKTSSHRDTA
jgi:hypothetical protein